MMKTESSPTLKAWLRDVGAEQAFETLAGLFPSAAVYSVDHDRRIVSWNIGAEKLLGFRREQVLGEHCLKASRCQECMSGCGIEQGDVNGALLHLFREDGASVAVKKYARGFRDAAGNFQGGIEVLIPAESDTTSAAPSALVPLLERTAAPKENFHGVLTREAGMREVFSIVRNVALTDVPVLIRGESGTGKELIAKAIHAESPRHKGPFLATNCAALAPALLESELFGHERGAFTGAVKEHKGVFERADGGTLFLDEVAELPLELQAKLLRVLQDMTFFRVGGTDPISVNVRIVSATHISLREAVAAGKFRADLMYRLRVVPVFLPPLRERRGDIPLLLQYFTDELNARGLRHIERISPEAMRRLLDHLWPGNIRELKNVLEYAFAVGRGAELIESDLPPEFRRGTALGNPGGVRPVKSGEEEKHLLAEALRLNDGHVGRAAASVGMSRPTFWRKRKHYGI